MTDTAYRSGEPPAAALPRAERMQVSAIIAREIERHGVRDVFGIMGSGNLRVIHDLTHHLGVAFHAARHEAGAVAAADGYARATGRIGVCTVTQGPGLTNSLTPLITARKANTPMVLLAGDSSTARTVSDPFAGVQSVAWRPFFDAADMSVIRTSPSTIVQDLAEAFARSIDTLQPVALLLPYEFAVTETAYVRRGPGPTARRQALDEAALDMAAARLNASARPLIIAGKGAVRAGAGEALMALADRLGAAVATTLPASGLFCGYPHDLGRIGGYSSRSVQTAVNAFDCVLAVGMGLNDYTTNKQTLLGNTHVIHVDRDPRAFGRFMQPGSTVVGDAVDVANALRARVQPRTQHPPIESVPEIAAALARPRREPFDDLSRGGYLDPRAVCARLDAILPRDRIVVTDGGRFASHVIRNMVVQAPRHLLHMQEFGAVGSGLGAAIGAAVGRPDKLTVLFLGDGGFLMALGDFDLAVRAQLPMLVVCMNDQALGSEITLLTKAGLDLADALLPSPDFAAIARAFGAGGRTITTLEELEEIPAFMDAWPGPLVLDCRIMREGVPAQE